MQTGQCYYIEWHYYWFGRVISVSLSATAVVITLSATATASTAIAQAGIATTKNLIHMLLVSYDSYLFQRPIMFGNVILIFTLPNALFRNRFFSD